MDEKKDGKGLLTKSVSDYEKMVESPQPKIQKEVMVEKVPPLPQGR